MYVVSGEVEVTEYDVDGRMDSQLCLPGTTVFREADSDQYDNHIHRIRCIKAAVSIHFYSGDARKGRHCYLI